MSSNIGSNKVLTPPFIVYLVWLFELILFNLSINVVFCIDTWVPGVLFPLTVPVGFGSILTITLKSLIFFTSNVLLSKLNG